MKKLLTVLKFILLAALIIGLAFGYLFFRVWQKNERPKIADSSWSTSEVLLGHSATLTLTIKAPWHREFDSAAPFTHPDFLAPVPDQATVTKGALSPLGLRTWTLKVPFVATDTKETTGLTAAFPVKKTNRISPNSIDTTLPPLTILSPEEIPDTPRLPDAFLTEDKPPLPDEPEATDRNAFPVWAWFLLAALIIPILIVVLKRTGIIKTTPPWEKALGNLAKLDPDSTPGLFYSRLTDILKQYTSERFRTRARSKTSAEFLNILRNHPQIPKEHLDQLTDFAALADAVKFADHQPDPAKAPDSLDLVRTFVTNTTPDPDEEKSKGRS